jgi:hypothetical protein
MAEQAGFQCQLAKPRLRSQLLDAVASLAGC